MLNVLNALNHWRKQELAIASCVSPPSRRSITTAKETRQMRFKGKVIYYILSQTTKAGCDMVKQKVKRNPGAMATYFAFRMLTDLLPGGRARKN